MNTLKIRPHHLLCLTLFRGKGYSRKFVENVKQIIKQMKKNDVLIEVTKGCDAICFACPHRLDNKCSKYESSEMQIQGLDLRILKRLGFNFEDILSLKDISSIFEEIDISDLISICISCEWLTFCKHILQQMKLETH